MHSTHPRQMNAESVRKSRGKPDRTRILPSSTADVQAAIAAIQSRSAAMRRQTAKTMSSLNNPDSRGERLTHQSHSDNIREGISTNNSTFDSDDSSNHAGQQYFTDIGAVIDHVNGKKKERELSASGEQKDEVDKDTISLSDSDVSSDSDDSLIAEGMVSNATQMNIGAFIDSLNAANKHSDHNGTPNVPDNAVPLAKSVSLDDSVHSTEGKDKYKISDEIAEEIVYDKAILGTYIKKADALAKSESPKVSDLEYVIFYARRDKVPIMPVLDTFDEGMVNREGFAVSRLSHFIRETILLIESKVINARKQSQLLDDISAENFDISMFKSMLKNPKKHVRFVEELEDLDIANISNKSGDSEEDGDDKENEDGQSHDEIEGGETQDVNVKPKVDTNRIYFENKMRQLAAAEKRFCREDLSRVPDVDGVASTRRIFTKRLFKRHPTLTPFRINTWKLSKDQRSNLHKGYTGVDSKTILSLAVQTDIPSTNEAFEWENLEMEMTKASDLIENTDFFVVQKDRLNRRHKEEYVQPTGVSMKKVKFAKEWEEDWYTSWTSHKNKRGNAGVNTHGAVTNSHSMQADGHGRPDVTPDDWGHDKSVGSILTTRLRVGERMSRVHHDYTSFLFMSKWKRKYYPKGIFTNVT